MTRGSSFLRAAGLRVTATSFLLVGAACGSSSSNRPTPTAESGTPTGLSPAACGGVEKLDFAGSVSVSLSSPGCLTFEPQGFPNALEARVTGKTGDSVVPLQLAPRIAFPSGSLPFGPDGCSPERPTALNIKGVGDNGDSQFEISVTCATSDDLAGHCDVPPAAQDVLRIEDSGAACVAWSAGTAVAFRIEVWYPGAAQLFAFVVPADRANFRLPTRAAPRLTESPELCRDRKEILLRVFALSPGRPEQVVGYTRASVECSITGS
jgi:hypothetical protein